MARIELPERGLHLEYESYGDRDARPLILVMGLGMQLVAWPPLLIEGLVGQGCRVVVFDNRDIGLSGSAAAAKIENLNGTRNHSMARSMLRYLLHKSVRAPYDLNDMAADTLALADALQIERFDLIGLSLGGMVAQKLAFRAPKRARSLVSVMSSAGPRTTPWAKLSVLPRFLSRPPKSSSLDRQVEHFGRLFDVLGCLTDPQERQTMRDRLRLALQRSYRPEGTARQLLAVLSEPDRSAEVAQIRCPVTLIHGQADPLVPIAAMEHLSRLLPAATVHRIPELGHYLPAWVQPILLDQISAHLQRS